MKVLINLSNEQHLFDKGYSGYAHGMMPVLDKPYVAYLIDQLKDQGYEQVYIVSTNGTHKINKTLGNGAFWSATFEYINTDTTIGLTKYHELVSEGVRIIRPENYLHIDEENNEEQSIATLDSYFDKSLAVLNDRDLFQLSSFEAQPHLYMSEGSKAYISSEYPIHLGQYTHLKQGNQVHGVSVIGAGSIVEHECLLDNTVIMPKTHVGRNLDLSNCLVTPHWIYNRVTKGLIEINEPEILCLA